MYVVAGSEGYLLWGRQKNVLFSVLVQKLKQGEWCDVVYMLVPYIFALAIVSQYRCIIMLNLFIHLCIACSFVQRQVDGRIQLI